MILYTFVFLLSSFSPNHSLPILWESLPCPFSYASPQRFFSSELVKQSYTLFCTYTYKGVVFNPPLWQNYVRSCYLVYEQLVTWPFPYLLQELNRAYSINEVIIDQKNQRLLIENTYARSILSVWPLLI